MGQVLTDNFDFLGHLTTFRAKNILENRPFEAENNARTLPKQL